MTVTRMSNRRRPSSSRSQAITPSRSTRSVGFRPSSSSQPSTTAGETGDTGRAPASTEEAAGRAATSDPFGDMGGQSSRGSAAARRDAGAGAAVSRSRDPGRHRFARSRRRRRCGPLSCVDGPVVRDGLGPGSRSLSAPSRRSTDAAARDHPGGEVGRPDVAGDLHVAADADAAGDDRPLADHGDPGVEAGGLLPVRGVRSAPSPMIAPGPTTTSLSRIARSTTAPRADDRVEHDDRVADDRADLDPDARRQDRVDDGPVDDAAVADQAAMDLGSSGRSGPGPVPPTGCG